MYEVTTNGQTFKIGRKKGEEVFGKNGWLQVLSGNYSGVSARKI